MLALVQGEAKGQRVRAEAAEADEGAHWRLPATKPRERKQSWLS